MSRRLLFSVLFALCLTACSGERLEATPTAVQGIGNAAVALLEKDMYLRLTQQSIDNERIENAARMTATQQVLDAVSTKVQRQENQQATEQAGEATKAAWQVTVAAGQAHDTATAQAQGTATQQAVIAITVTFEAQATTEADKKTQQAPMIAAQQTAVKVESEKAVLELQKAQSTQWVSAWGPVGLILVALLAGLFYLWKKSQVGVILDENGRVRLVMVNKRALQPDLMFGPVIDFSERRGATAPALGVSDDIQRQIVHETKIVEAISSLPPGYPRQAVGMAGSLTSNPAAQVKIQVVHPDRLGPVLDEVESGLLEGA